MVSKAIFKRLKNKAILRLKIMIKLIIKLANFRKLCLYVGLTHYMHGMNSLQHKT